MLQNLLNLDQVSARLVLLLLQIILLSAQTVNWWSNQSKVVECEVCDKWYHTSCQNISNALYEVLICEETTNVSWFCKCCNQGAKSMMTKIYKLNERQGRVENGLVMLTELHQNLNERLTSLGSSLEAGMTTQEKVTEERFSTMETVFTSRMQKLKTQSVDGAADMAREMEYRQDTANNIIMFNVPESSAGSRVQQGDDANIHVVKKICVILGADNAKIITRRLGRKTETETRPIRVEMTDLNNKKTILKNARHLREGEDLTLRNVYIAQDLTPSQREEQKELRRRRKTMLEELQEKGITDTTVIIRKENTLDLIFSIEQGRVDNVEHNPPIGKSHHVVLQWRINC